MSADPTIDRGIVASIIASLDSLEADSEALVEDSGLVSIWSDTPPEVLPEAQVWGLFERSARTLDMPDVGLRVGNRFRIRELGMFGRQLENSLTTWTCLSDYIATVNRYSSHSQFWMDKQASGAWFCRRGIELINCGRDQVEQFTVQLMINLVRLACGPNWFPSAITVQAATNRIYHADPNFDSVHLQYDQPSTAIWVSITDMMNIVQRDDDPVTRCIRNGITMDQHTGHTIRSVAQQLGFSVRTIQRELSSCGLDWTRLVDQVRLDHANVLIKTEMALADIARELGYTDAANFGRAFKRWTGVTPKLYRRLVAGNECR